MPIPLTGLFIVVAVSHGLVTVLETLKNVLRTMNEYEESFPLPKDRDRDLLAGFLRDATALSSVCLMDKIDVITYATPV